MYIRPGLSSLGLFFYFMKNKAYFSFLDNMDKISEKIETKQKNEAIGKIVSALQRPFTEVLQAVVLKQEKDVNELLKSLKWRKTT